MIQADCGTENTYVAALQSETGMTQWLQIKFFCMASQFPFNVLKHGEVYLGGAAQTGGFAF